MAAIKVRAEVTSGTEETVGMTKEWPPFTPFGYYDIVNS